MGIFPLALVLFIFKDILCNYAHWGQTVRLAKGI